MAKSNSFKWCALIVVGLALYLYHQSNKSSQQTTRFGNSAQLMSDTSELPSEGIYTAVPARDPNSIDQMSLEAEMLQAPVRDEIILDGSSPGFSARQISEFDNNLDEPEPFAPSDDELFEFENGDSESMQIDPPQLPSRPQVAEVAAPIRLPEGVLTKAIQHIEYGKALARRGAVFGAKNEFHNALRLIAQAVDYQNNSQAYSESLYKAMVALKEADDFYRAQGENDGRVDVDSIARHHESRILSVAQMREMNCVSAMQEYYNFIQRNFAVAGGKSIVASEAMFCLGKLYVMKGKDIVEGSPLDNAKAIVHHRAALECNQRNYKSANELAVLLAKTGRLDQAKNLLVHSLKIQQVPQAWENLAFIHEQLGEHDLAQMAYTEFRRMMSAPPSTQQIKWVSPEQFAAGSSEPVALRTAMNPKQNNEVNTEETKKTSTIKNIFKKMF